MPSQLNTPVRQNFFFILVALVTVSFFGLVGQYLLSAFWAIVLTIIFHRSYRRLRISLRGRDNLAASIMTVGILLFVVLPVFGIMAALVDQAVGLYERIQNGDIDPSIAIKFLQEQLPEIESFLQRVGVDTQEIRDNISSTALQLSSLVADRAFLYTQNAINLIVQFSVVMYLLFFFLRDGNKLLNEIINVLPMGNRRERVLFNRFGLVAKATLKGTLVVAIVQGSIGGVLFWALGIPAALLWGVAMAVLSLLPVAGAGIVWVPTAITLAIMGDYGKAIIIVIVGSLGIGLVDNLLRPLLVGRDTRMPDYLVLLTTLGGIAWFGISGFVIGPVIAALFITIWQMMGREFGGREA